MAAFGVANSAPSTSGRACAQPAASSGVARSSACAWQARCPQRQQRRRWRQRHPGGGSGGSRLFAASSDKPEWFQALEETAHLDEDVARLLASAKNNPDAVRQRMQAGKLKGGPGCWVGPPAFLLNSNAADRNSCAQPCNPALRRFFCLQLLQNRRSCHRAPVANASRTCGLPCPALAPNIACLQSRSSSMHASWAPNTAAKRHQWKSGVPLLLLSCNRCAGICGGSERLGHRTRC